MEQKNTFRYKHNNVRKFSKVPIYSFARSNMIWRHPIWKMCQIQFANHFIPFISRKFLILNQKMSWDPFLDKV